MGLLADVYSYGNFLKRRVGGLLDDPRATLEQFVGQLADSRREDEYLQKVAGNQILKAPGEKRSVVSALAPELGPSIGYPQRVDAVTPQQREWARSKQAEKAANMAIQAATVWHGSPHKFDKFDSSKIGTGEGAQAYGHGLYLAESPEVATGYRDKLSKTVTVDGKQLTSIPSDGPMGQAHNMVVTSIQGGMTPEQAIAHTKKYWMDASAEMLALKQSHPELAARIDAEAASRQAVAAATDSMRPESFFKDPGSLYKVDLPDDAIAKMLDWDKPLSQQPQNVQEAFNLSKHPADSPIHNMTGMEAYVRYGNRFGKPTSSTPETATAFRELGIPGIRYLDGGSRGTGAGTSNFVVFPGNEGLLTILERNGQPLK